MTRFVVDGEVLLRIASGNVVVHPDHELVAPAGIRSEALSALYAAVQRGDLDRKAALERLERLAEVKMRLLNDRASRRAAFLAAEKMGLADTTRAEYVAITQLQADALVTLDKAFARAAKKLVHVEPVDALTRP
ncbi:MAG TPA: hypothetical protein VGU02_09740 [Gaiellaceae bacterium]|nr:hypothetical protein [Gaiellaceae bacterium]